MMEMPKPTSGHAKLQILDGHREGEERMHPSQWDPKGGIGVGKMRNWMSLSGFALISDYEQERDGVVAFAGHGVFTFDAEQGLYALHWFDCMGSPPEAFHGRFEGDVLTLAHGGPGIHARMTYDLTDPLLMRSRMETSQDGAAWNTLFDGSYEQLHP